MRQVVSAAVTITISVILGLYLRMDIRQGLSPGDPNSFSRPDTCRVKQVHLNWDVDFQSKKLKGYVDLEVERIDSTNNDLLILDTRDLIISSVLSVETKESLDFSLGSPVDSFGSKLDIKLNPATTTVRINYETVPTSTALQWMSPEQTAGKEHPYLFSQCEAIHARSMLPCQDTPSVKAPFTAKVSVPKELVVLMSAIGDGKEESMDPSKITYKFHQKVPIPSYLIAIAVGALESRKIGPRSHVWSEKEFLDKSAYEFAETEAMLSAAESFLGPYVWGIYDLLVLPPSFPMGGMENPCLTFLTPTLLAGDRSLASVVAHEISHSWTGNLVTNSNFEHFWLNEGFTRFVENIIGGKLNDEKFRHFQSLEGWADLEEEVNKLGKDNPMTQLVVDLKGVDPDDAFSRIPYEKGSAFLMHLEQLLGGKEIFEGFLRAYIEEFKYKSIDSDDFKSFLYRYFKDKVEVLNSVDWNGWMYKPGMPPVKPNYDDTLVKQCVALSHKWINSSVDDIKSFTNEDFKELSSSQVIVFLQLLLNENKALPLEKLEKMTQLYEFDINQNCEIRSRWLRLAIQSRWKKVVPLVLTFVTEIGRMKYITPLYSNLYAWDEVRDQAIETFRKNRPQMMHMSAHAVAKVLHLA